MEYSVFGHLCDEVEQFLCRRRTILNMGSFFLLLDKHWLLVG